MNKTWKSLKQSRLSPEAQARVRARVDANVEALTLKAMRQELELTQAERSKSTRLNSSHVD